MSVLRAKFPQFYALYQEIIGEVYYELLGIGPLLRFVSTHKLKSCERLIEDPIKVAFSYRGAGLYKKIVPLQIESEIRNLFNFVKETQPKVVCEIGSDEGGTL